MRSIGLELRPWVDAGLLRLHSIRPTAFGFEEHLASLHRVLDEADPSLVVLDAVGSLGRGGDHADVSSLVSRDLDLLKARGITAVMTTLTHGQAEESSDVDVSSLVDTWLLLRNHEDNGERNRLLFVIKSRGTAHSNQVREFVLTDEGPELVEVYVGPDGVLTGSARIAQIAQEDAAAANRDVEAEQRRYELVQRRAAVESKIAALQAQLAAETAELERFLASRSADR